MINTDNSSNSNYCVIMAGGVGSRFWPQSRESKPKQFLDFFGTGRSLLQMTIDRFRPIVPIENIFIATNQQYKSLILEQIPDLNENQILCEPVRRNTAPCIAYATMHIKAIAKSKNVNIIVAPADHLILNENEFLRVISTGLQFISTNDALLTLGMKPTRPEIGYGYIKKSEDKQDIVKVQRFCEKPNLKVAEQFLADGNYLWNSGMFLWTLNSIEKALQAYLPGVYSLFANDNGAMLTSKEAEFVNNAFLQSESISIDYGIMEKADNVYVEEADFGWSDLGTWGSLFDIAEHDDAQNATLHGEALYYNSNSNVVSLPEGKMAVIEGLDGYIVADTADALLICRKQQEQQIRQFSNDIKPQYR